MAGRAARGDSSLDLGYSSVDLHNKFALLPLSTSSSSLRVDAPTSPSSFDGWLPFDLKSFCLVSFGYILGQVPHETVLNAGQLAVSLILLCLEFCYLCGVFHLTPVDVGCEGERIETQCSAVMSPSPSLTQADLEDDSDNGTIVDGMQAVPVRGRFARRDYGDKCSSFGRLSPLSGNWIGTCTEYAPPF